MIAREAGKKLQEYVNGAGLSAPFKNLLIQPLSSPGKILSSDPSVGWAELVGAACDSAGGDRSAAVRVAAAVEAFAAALDVLDEIEDGDQSHFVDSAGVPQALNASTALIFLAQNILVELSTEGILPERVFEFSRVMSRLGLAATNGQHHDLSITAFSEVSLDEALQITSQKSGSLASCACLLGAMLGTSDQSLLHLYESFGYHYGTMVQLSNDLHDSQDSHTKSDIKKLKPTLPILFYVRQRHDVGSDEVRPEDVRDSGALHFTWTVVEMQRQRCLKILEQLDGRHQATDYIRNTVTGLASQEHTADDQP